MRGLLFGMLLLTASVAGHAANGSKEEVGAKPYMGWSSWSLQSTKVPQYGGKWLTQKHLTEQSNALKKTLQPYGYKYFNIDSGWSGGFDAYGRPAPNKKTFPGGMAGMAKIVHGNGQKLGIYWIPGVGSDVYKANPPIKGTKYHVRDIVAKPLRPGNAFGAWHLKIDYKKPGAQAFINSIVEQFASWGVDFLKLDGVCPGSDKDISYCDNRADVAAYWTAIRKSPRPIWMTVSWKISPTQIPFWQNHSHARRIDDDVESYSDKLATWSQIRARFTDAAAWAGHTGRGGKTNGAPRAGWNDLDSLNIANGSFDGLTNDEKQTAAAFWALQCAPLYTGDDLTKLDPFGLSILTNKSLIAINQAGYAAKEIQGDDAPIWAISNPDGSYSVGLFNLSDLNTVVTLDFSQMKKNGDYEIWDYWTQSLIGHVKDSYPVLLAPHACSLVRVK
jgi:hypothetical protein